MRTLFKLEQWKGRERTLESVTKPRFSDKFIQKFKKNAVNSNPI